jgi:hypothetical protein
MTPKGYVFLIGRAGGKAWTGKGSVNSLRDLVKGGYFIETTITTLAGGHHAVDFRGFIQRAGVEHAVFGDPYFGCEIAGSMNQQTD